MVNHAEHEDHHEHREITIDTLTSPPVQVKPAPNGRRVGATFIDSAILLASWLIMRSALGLGLPVTMMEVPSIAPTVYLAALTFAYYFVLEGFFAATLGKSLMRIQVLKSDGDPCSFSESFKRNVVRYIDWLPLIYVLGGIFVLASSKRQRLGDLVAGTIVAPKPEKDINPPPAPFLFH